MKRRKKQKMLERKSRHDFFYLSKKCDVIILDLIELKIKVSKYPSDFIESIDRINAAANDLNNICKRRRNGI